MQSQSHKLYILIDKKLSPSQRAVQACHAGIEFAKKYPDWKHQSVVLLGCDGEVELIDKAAEFLFASLPFTAFAESYWDNRITAVAVHGADEILKGLELL
jgi:hypothetical protein